MPKKLTRLRWRRFHQARASAPRGFSDSHTSLCDLGTGDLDCVGASPPIPGQSTDCSNHSTPADCTHERAPDAIHTQDETTWWNQDSSALLQAGVGFRLPCPLPPWGGARSRRHSSECRRTHPAWTAQGIGKSCWLRSGLRIGPAQEWQHRQPQTGWLDKNDCGTRKERGRPPRSSEPGLDDGDRLFLKFFVRFASLLLRKLPKSNPLHRKKQVWYPKRI